MAGCSVSADREDARNRAGTDAGTSSAGVSWNNHSPRSSFGSEVDMLEARRVSAICVPIIIYICELSVIHEMTSVHVTYKHTYPWDK